MSTVVLDREMLQRHGYIVNPEIETTLQLALALQKPILVEGPAGTGKTSLAIATANALQRPLYRIQCYEGITVEQIIGEFDYKKQLLKIELTRGRGLSDSLDIDSIFSEEFFIKRPLFSAMTSDEPTVLLFDEIDKADEEFEAFLLEALGEKQITIPELGTFQQKNDMLVFLTSNSTRDLTEALRRRCLYLYLDFPSTEREKEIISLHCGPRADERLLKDITKLVARIRELPNLKKIPSISESIEWAKALIHLGIQEITLENYQKTANVLLKYREDIQRVEELLKNTKLQ